MKATKQKEKKSVAPQAAKSRQVQKTQAKMKNNKTKITTKNASKKASISLGRKSSLQSGNSAKSTNRLQDLDRMQLVPNEGKLL